MTQKLIIGFLIFSIIGFNCSKLDETFEGDLTPDQVAGGGNSVSSLLTGTYNSMRTTFQDQTRVYCLWEMTTDELIGPTRGPDWDDNASGLIVVPDLIFSVPSGFLNPSVGFHCNACPIKLPDAPAVLLIGAISSTY